MRLATTMPCRASHSIVCFFLLFAVGMGAALATDNRALDAFIGPDTLIEAWTGSYGSLELIPMRFSCTERVADIVPSSVAPDSLDRLTRFLHADRVQEGEHYRLHFSSSPEGFADPDSVRQYSFDGDCTMTYDPGNKTGVITRGLQGLVSEHMPLITKYMLADHDFQHKEPNLTLTYYKAWPGTGKVLPKLESVCDEPCHVLEIGSRDGDYPRLHRVWLAHEKGMLPLKYQVYAGDTLDTEIVVEEIGMVDADGNDFWYPKKASRMYRDRDGGIARYELQTHSLALNPTISSDTFRLTFPPGTYLLDDTTGLSYKIGTSDVEDVLQDAFSDAGTDRAPVASSANSEDAGAEKSRPPRTEGSMRGTSEHPTGSMGDAQAWWHGTFRIVLVVAVLAAIVSLAFLLRHKKLAKRRGRS